ncbi:hypothetical protein [Natrinema versiforme]|uniref:Uncharacterized protein n=1 Tax=Natrinema versiforme JCM 10478 TaxID=1227496 RepID=L9YAH3_9EURY|nr:hypothetical protein [Natrinema versiforme]ELY71035.1 hypothetical protein C489_01726 [Natrinema versiforme JCM 10478]
MALDELLEGTALTGRQAAIIFFSFLCLIIVAGLILITFSDFFRDLFMLRDAAGVRVGVLALVAGRSTVGYLDS